MSARHPRMTYGFAEKPNSATSERGNFRVMNDSAAARAAANGPPVIVRLVSSTNAALNGIRFSRSGVSAASTRCPFSVTTSDFGALPPEG